MGPGDNGAMWRSLLLALCLVAPLTPQAPTTVEVTGAIPTPLTLTTQDLATLPRVKVTATSHDQTSVYEGVRVRDILTRAGVPAGAAIRGAELAKTVIVTGADGYRAAFGLAEFDEDFTDRAAILADRRDGAPLAPTAAPFQLILTGEKRPARWVRQVVSIEIRANGGR